jgi:hypothetical protein
MTIPRVALDPLGSGEKEPQIATFPQAYVHQSERPKNVSLQDTLLADIEAPEMPAIAK